jgi:hypothetical protein
MNIFIVNSDPVIAAWSLCDKHYVKMVLETAQLLCSCCSDAPYKPAFLNHPCSKWVRQSINNFDWLCKHGIALCEEYTFRYGKKHKSQEVIEWCMEHKPDLPKVGQTPFVQAMPDEYKNKDPVVAYRKYYIGAKKHILVYTKRMPPSWLGNLARQK